MRKFLRYILMRNSLSPENNQNPILGDFFIDSPRMVYNNACETFWEGAFRIPDGFTATVEGTVVSGFEGSGNPGPNNGLRMILGIVNYGPGLHQFTINLGNSGEAGVASTYVLRVTLNNGDSKTELRRRRIAESIFYDQAPC